MSVNRQVSDSNSIIYVTDLGLKRLDKANPNGGPNCCGSLTGINARFVRVGRFGSLWKREIWDSNNRGGGEGGIRTHGTVARTPHFECGAFDHSATSP